MSEKMEAKTKLPFASGALSVLNERAGYFLRQLEDMAQALARYEGHAEITVNDIIDAERVVRDPVYAALKLAESQ